jgi:hypothetical protein
MLGELRFISRSFYKVEVRIYGGDSFYIFSNFTRAHSASAAGHRPEYSSLDLSNIWPRFSSEVLFTFTRIYIDTPQIEVELYGGTLRQIFMLGATNFQYKKSIDRSYTGLKIDLRWVATIS